MAREGHVDSVWPLSIQMEPRPLASASTPAWRTPPQEGLPLSPLCLKPRGPAPWGEGQAGPHWPWPFSRVSDHTPPAPAALCSESCSPSGSGLPSSRFSRPGTLSQAPPSLPWSWRSPSPQAAVGIPQQTCDILPRTAPPPRPGTLRAGAAPVPFTGGSPAPNKSASNE